MPIKVDITGLDKFNRDLEESSRALQALEGEIVQLRFNPKDPHSIQAAIDEMETAIDTKIDPYRSNHLVSSLAQQLKERYKLAIYEKASEDREEPEDAG